MLSDEARKQLQVQEENQKGAHTNILQDLAEIQDDARRVWEKLGKISLLCGCSVVALSEINETTALIYVFSSQNLLCFCDGAGGNIVLLM